MRRYCWRIGGPVKQRPGTKCMECGSPIEKHEVIYAEHCGCFATCLCPCESKDDHGHPCEREPGHGGKHSAGCCMVWDATRRLQQEPAA